MQRAVSAGSYADVLVNNRCEGDARLTVQGLSGDVARLTRGLDALCPSQYALTTFRYH